MMKIKIFLVSGEIIEIEKKYVFIKDISNELNNNNDNANFENYIIPKSSINYVNVEKIESEEK